MSKLNPRITAVKAKEDFTLELVFKNGEKKIFDMKPYLSTGVFRELKNFNLFKTVRPCFGSISWKNGQDLCPDTLYLDSKKEGPSDYIISRREPKLVAAGPKSRYNKRK